MEFEGKVIFDLPMQEGISRANNPWKKKEWVAETFGQYPRKVKFHIFGEERITRIPLELGKSYRFQVDVESREFNGRWYTDVNCFGATEIAGPSYGTESQPGFGASPAPAAPAQPFGAAPAQPFGAAPAQPFAPAGEPSDDLPF